MVGSIRSIAGIPKAAVFPDPVCDWPMTSRPARSNGMVSAWIDALTALSLAQAWLDEQTRPPRAPRRPGEGEVPAARFGPHDRRVGSERK